MWSNRIVKRVTLYVGIFLLLSSFFVVDVPQVFAQPGEAPAPIDGTRTDIPDSSNTQSPDKCGIVGIYINPAECLTAVAAGLSIAAVQVVSWFFGIIGLFLDLIIEYTVTNVADTINSQGISIGIQEAWKLIRDLINLSFIFILLYQSIMLIIGRSSESGKVIVRLVMVALLINFSMFVTRVVVDASNVVATGFYDQINPPTEDLQNRFFPLSVQYMRVLGIPATFSGSLEQLRIEGVEKGNSYIILLRNLGALVFITITAFVFLAAALMFLVRYIIILFLMILSPVAFAGYIVPGTQSISRQWWDTLIGQALFAPIFMILTWVNLTLASRIFESKTSGQDLGQIFIQGQNGVVLENSLVALFNFSLLIGLAIASLMIARSYAKKGGSHFSTLSSYIGGAALGAVAWGSRRTVGWASQKALDSKSLNLEKRAENSALWRTGLRLSEKGATSTFDLRNNVVAQKTGALSDFGQFKVTRGYRQALEETADKKAKFAERIGGAKKETLADIDRYEGAVYQAREYLRNAKTDAEKLTGQKMLSAAQKELNKTKKKAEAERKAGRATYAHEMERKRLGNFFNPSKAALEASTKVQKKLGGEDEKAQNKEKIAGLNSYFESLIDSRDFATLSTELGNLNAGDFTKLKPKILQSDPALLLVKPADLKALAKRDDMSLQDRNDTIEAVRVHASTLPDTPQKHRLRDFFATPAGLDL